MTVARSVLYSSAAAVATLVNLAGRSDLVVVSAADEHVVPAAAATMGSGTSLMVGDSSFPSTFSVSPSSSSSSSQLPLSSSDRHLVVNDGERDEKVVVSYQKKTKKENHNNYMLRSASTSVSTPTSSSSSSAATSGSTSSGTSLVRKKAGGSVSSTRSSSSEIPNMNNINIDQTISLESRQKLEETGRLISSYFLEKKHQRQSGILPLHRRTQEEEEEDEETIARMEEFDTCLVDVDIAVKQEPVCDFSGATELTCTNDISRYVCLCLCLFFCFRRRVCDDVDGLDKGFRD